jgi:hypothetical protein
MTREEAQDVIAGVRNVNAIFAMTRPESGLLWSRGLEVGSYRDALLALHERRGWAALGYRNWRECVVAEFGGSPSRAYRQLQAARDERRLSG